MDVKDIKVSREAHEIIRTYKRPDESMGNFVHRCTVHYIENSGDIYLPRHKIIKAMILEEPEEMKGQVAVDIQTVDFNGKELGRNWAIYDSIEEAKADQLPSTEGIEVFEKLKD